MWNLEPYVHNPMSIITEACDKAEFAHMALNKKAVNSKGWGETQAKKIETEEGLAGRSKVGESWWVVLSLYT